MLAGVAMDKDPTALQLILSHLVDSFLFGHSPQLVSQAT